jgi:hypothetical protein
MGGTCNNSKWRDALIPKLEIDYYNPVVEDWTEECMIEEIKQREKCEFVLYTITPKMTGVYSIAEVIDDSNKRPFRTLICILENDDGLIFTKGQRKSLKAVQDMVERNGGKSFNDLDEVAKYIKALSYINHFNQH